MIYQSTAPVGTAIRTTAFVPHPQTGVQLLPAEVDHCDLIVTSGPSKDPLLELHNLDVDVVLSDGVTAWPSWVDVPGGAAGYNFDHTIYYGENGFEPLSGMTLNIAYWLWIEHADEPGKFDPVIVQHQRKLTEATGIGLVQP